MTNTASLQNLAISNFLVSKYKWIQCPWILFSAIQMNADIVASSLFCRFPPVNTEPFSVYQFPSLFQCACGLAVSELCSTR